MNQMQPTPDRMPHDAVLITAALMRAGVDPDRITDRPDGIVRVRRGEGEWALIGEDPDGGWWDWTHYAGGDIAGTDGSRDLDRAASDIAAWLASS